MSYENIFDENAIKAIKMLINGMVLTETTEEYSSEDGDLKLVKRKVNEKTLPPNTDILKMIYTDKKEDVNKYKEMSDEDLIKERKRLLLELKEEENANREHNDKD